MIEQDQNKK